MPALSSLVAALEARPDRSRVIDVNGAIGAFVLGALWFILCRHLSGEWSVNEQYAYGWFVPLFAILLFWLRWEDRPPSEMPNPKLQIPEKSIAIGLILFALLLFLPLRVFEIGNPDWRPLGWIHAALVVGLTLSFIWTIGGLEWLRHFAFPVCFIFVAVPWISPIEQPIVQGLMRLVAAVAAEVLSLLGIPAQLEGNLIRVSNGLVGVNEACSGVRSLQTSLMIGLLFGEIKRLSILHRLVLVAGAIAIALGANLLRALFLVWIAASKGLAQTGRWHDFAGYAIVALVFVGSLLLAAALGRKKTRVGIQEKEVRQQQLIDGGLRHLPHSIFYLGAALVWILFVEVASATWYRAHEHGLQLTERWTVRWPESEPGFREIQINSGVQETLRFDKGREAAWRDAKINFGESATCLLFFFRWEPGTSTILRARAHRPDICLPSTGWRQVADHGIRSYQAGPNFWLPFRHFTFAREAIDNQRPLFADAFFCLNEDAVRDGQTGGSALLEPSQPGSWEREARWRVVRDGIRNPGQQVMQFILVSPREASSVEERFAELLPRLVTKAPSDSIAEQPDR